MRQKQEDGATFEFIKSNGKRKAFHQGGNSSRRFHIRQHFKVYEEKCKQADIPVNHWAILRHLWKAMEDEKAAEKQGHMTKKEGLPRITLGFSGPTRTRI